MSIVAYYRLNGDCNDASGNGYHLTNYNSVPFVAGKFGDCASFASASNQYLDVATATSIGSGNITISCWATVTTVKNGYMFLVEQGNTTVGNLMCYCPSGGQGYFWWDRLRMNVAEDILQVSLTFSAGVWQHFCYTYDGANVKGYWNGAYQGSKASTGVGSAGTAHVCIGRSANRSPTYYYQGKVDEVIIDNTAWSDAQVRNYYNFAVGRYAPKMTF